MAHGNSNHSLTEWEIFVLRHQKPGNVAGHFVSFLLFWASPLLALTVSPWWWMGFFTSGLVGTLSHIIFKDGGVNVREATSSLQVVHFSSKMALLYVIGKYQSEIVQTKTKAGVQT